MIPKEQVNMTKDLYRLDITEVEARIYNILRQFDFMELDNFDFAVIIKQQ